MKRHQIFSTTPADPGPHPETQTMTRSFNVTTQNYRNGDRIKDAVTLCTGKTEAEVLARWRGYRVVSIVEVATPVPSNQTGLSGCGVHSFYVD